ncbi:gp53-like domain-containing protein [Megamonas hypermegale]|uniref:gp53-like domain-containing protein n=1 Tax=Megamonas hypermegale TaxID=158847 RepID=UPI0026F34D74|nr:hypothetical protein [Megamonas hypermegale]
MANLSGYQLTNSGRSLLAKVGSGACTLRFTKVKFSEDETSLNDLLTKTDLVGTSLKQIDIVGSKAQENIFTIIATVTNIGLEKNFLIRQVGVFAEGIAATSPAEGTTAETVSETLFAVAYDTLPDIIPAGNISVNFTRQFNINMVVSNASTCSVVTTPTGVITQEILDLHNADEQAHSSLINRLFETVSATKENIKNSIKNWCKETIAELFGIVSATTDNLKTKIKEWALEQIEEWLESQGIRYNMAQNGYLCLGHFLGDAIIQWGSVQGGNNWDIPYNIAFTNKLFVVLAWDFAAGSNTGMQFVGGNFQQSNRDTFHLYTSNAGGIGLGYIAIGF